ncbi:hypothetical protein MPTK1_1g18330 [Marchantia polymorpha subsp. ruderalis]|uniref:Uncharacterized protein n=2 Tax=Marchantia polymorpha TaxID=3197 RepID=A0AAF6ARI4_MARPO|nr:hypothetical protein MARPO_0001s0171 [Marchantia polymorpha]BBM99054.1 hypothetical protein Mp_1g18330 [Marchantia polymorpha subsp. ruderalis]|eukprot:PTQ50130.1 hypothetical protein MARPO_0001s0171 [Marchantia polymorpha]
MCSLGSLSLNFLSRTRSQSVLSWRLTQSIGGAGCRVMLVIATDLAIQLHRLVVNADGCTTSSLTVPNHISNPAMANVKSYTKARDSGGLSLSLANIRRNCAAKKLAMR